MSRFLVTGVAGFIGSHLSDRLLKLGHEVVGVDGFTDYYPREYKLRNLVRSRSQDNFRLVEGDLMELDLYELLRGTSGVIHLAAQPGVRASWGTNFSLYLRRNVEATQRLLEATSKAGPERFVFASSSSVYGSAGDHPVAEDAPRRPASPYGLSKLAAEELINVYARERGLPATVLRYFTVYGPRQRPEMALARFIDAAIRRKPVEIFGDGLQIREMTYVSDVVDATVASLEARPGGCYNVGGGLQASVNDMVQTVSQALGTPIETRYGPAAEGDVRSTWADTERARLGLGFEPRVGLQEGIEAQAKWSLGEVSN